MYVHDHRKSIAQRHLADIVTSLRPSEPMLLLDRQELICAAQAFLTYFPGQVLYAVKCNPHSVIIDALTAAGIHRFDVASLAEIELVRRQNPQLVCYFNHPIKSREAIRVAATDYGITDFTVDCSAELDKIDDLVPVDQSTIAIRVAVQSGSKTYDFAEKFGLSTSDSISLALKLAHANRRWGLTFHVGSQCEDLGAYQKALTTCRDIIAAVGASPAYINVGGGFPTHYPGSLIPPLTKYFDLIADLKQSLQLPALLCEPGRALAAAAGTLIVQVLQRKDTKLYLNDGQYGALGELDYAHITPDVHLLRPATGKMRQYTIFGPTCDSYDALETSFVLPEDVREGDWIAIRNMGAYSTSLTTNFNGFSSRLVSLFN